jgi:hypothetical protein
MAPVARRARTPWWMLVVVIVAGALLGGVIAEATSAYPALGLLSRDIRAGVDPPLTVDLRVVTLTGGFTVRLDLATVVGILLAVWIFRLLH